MKPLDATVGCPVCSFIDFALLALVTGGLAAALADLAGRAAG